MPKEEKGWRSERSGDRWGVGTGKSGGGGKSESHPRHTFFCSPVPQSPLKLSALKKLPFQKNLSSALSSPQHP